MPETERVLTKGQQTREEILKVALELSCSVGLDGMSIGALAEKTGLSKSGLYAHFESKEDLQCAVLDSAADQFITNVLKIAFQAPRGIPRIEMIFDLWVDYKDEICGGGCPLIAAATDFDSRPGPVHDKVRYYIDGMLENLAKAVEIAKEDGQFDPSLDTRLFAYEIWGILLSYLHYRRLLRADDAIPLAKRAFGNLIERAVGPGS